MKTKLFLSITMIALIFNSCSYQQKKTVLGQDGKAYVVIDEKPDPIKKFGNGIYYYQFTDHESYYICKEFGPALAEFITKHPEEKIVIISPLLEKGDQNDVAGYWIITEPRVACPCDTTKKIKKSNN